MIPGAVDHDAAAIFDAKIVESFDGFTIIALEDNYVDAWADRLNISGAHVGTPTLNFRVVHHIANTLGDGCPFAIIETE